MYSILRTSSVEHVEMISMKLKDARCIICLETILNELWQKNAEFTLEFLKMSLF